MQRKSFLPILLASAVSCQDTVAPTTGSILLQFQTNSPQLGSVDRWTLTVDGEGGTRSKSGAPGETVTIDGLVPGPYTVIVAGFEGSYLVLRDDGSVSVAAGATRTHTANPQSAVTIVPNDTAVALNAIDATVQLTATVMDGDGETIAGATLAFNSADNAVAMVDASGLVTAIGNGNTSIEISDPARNANVDVPVAVQQVPATLVKVSGDLQTGPVGMPLADNLVAEVDDANGHPIEGHTVDFTAAGGSGTLSPAQGTSDANGQVSTAWTLGPSPGTHEVTLSVAGSSVAGVTFTATAGALPFIDLSPTTLSFAAQEGTNPATQTFTIDNTGSGTLNWSAADDQPWIDIAPTSGTVDAGNSVTVTATVTSASLVAGGYTGTITVSDPGSSNQSQDVAVDLTVTQKPEITLNPTALSFAAQEGTNPATQSFTIDNTGSGTLNWSAADDQPWIDIAPTSGTVDAGNSVTVTVTVTSASLVVGGYTGTITVSDPGSSNQSQDVTVDLTVTQKPEITLNPTTLTYTALIGTNPGTQTFTIDNTGSGTLDWTLISDQTWLTLSSTTGSLPSGDPPVTVTATVTSAGLPAGSHTATITVSDPNASNTPQTIAVNLTVTQPTIQLNATALSFTAQELMNPPTQTFTVANSGTGVLSFTVTDNQPWLSVSPTSGTVPVGAPPITVTVTVTSASLAPGGYTATITVTDPNASNSPETIAVDLTSTPAPAIGLSPSLSFTVPEGDNSVTKTFTITNTGGGTLDWSATESRTWLSVSPPSGMLQPGPPQTVTVTVNTANLAPGFYTGPITVGDPDATNSPQSVTVNLTVDPVDPGLVYVMNTASDDISVIDVQTGTVVKTISVTSFLPSTAGPREGALTSDGDTLYVTVRGDSSVAIIPTSGNTVTDTVWVGSGPVDIVISPNGSLLYVARPPGNHVRVIETATQTLSTIATGTGPFAVAFNPDGPWVYTANSGSNDVSVINPTTQMIVATVPVGMLPTSIDVDSIAQLAYVGNFDGNSISVINLNTNTTLPAITGFPGNPSGLKVSPDGSLLYVSNSADASVTVIDTGSNMLLATIPVGASPAGIEFSSDSKLAFVASTDANTVSVIDTATHTKINEIQVGTSPVGLVATRN